MGEKRQKPTLKIGQLAKRLGLNVRTLRYYEAIGLLPEPARTDGGYRVYTDADEELLRFILRAKQVGFSLEEIRRIIRLGRHGKACGYVQETLSRHIAAIEAQIADLQRRRAALSAAKATWPEAATCAESGRLCGLIEGWPFSPQTTNQEKPMTDKKRNIEVFTAGCPLCDETVQLVKSLACDNCEVTIYDLREGCATDACRSKAQEYGVHRVPAVVIDGSLADCCRTGPLSAETLQAAGLGANA